MTRYYRTTDRPRRWVAADDGGWIPGTWQYKWLARLGVRKYYRMLESDVCSYCGATGLGGHGGGCPNSSLYPSLRGEDGKSAWPFIQ